MSKTTQLRIIEWADARGDDDASVLRLCNDTDPSALAGVLQGFQRIELHFPHFTDGRAYSQAYLLRRRLGFTGDLRATGDVQMDQLLQMARTGFSSAVLKEGLKAADAARHLDRFDGFYQRDLVGN